MNGSNRSSAWSRWLPWLMLALALLGGAAWFALTFRPDTVEDLDVEVELAEELGARSITLFFAGADAQGMVGETRTIATRSHREEEIETVVAELVLGPRSENATSVFPKNAQLRRAFYDDRERILYLDFNGALVADLNAGSATELALLGSLMRTIAIGFPEIESVQILVDGLEVETLAGHVDLTRPLRTGDWL